MLVQNMLKSLNSWPRSRSIPICLGFDVGGSGVRARISSYLDSSKTIDLPHTKARSSKDLIASLSRLDAMLRRVVPGCECRGSSIALAGPINRDAVVLTNWPGPLRERTLRIGDLPPGIFPKGRTLFLNDLEAGAYGIIAAKNMRLLDSFFEQMWPARAPKGPLVSSSRTAVLALGSGLGVALIVQTPLLRSPLVVPTELGHLQIPIVGPRHPGYAEERALFEYVSSYYYRGRDTLEYEDVASGRGLCLGYRYIVQRDSGVALPMEELDGNVIAAKARSGDRQAKEAVGYQMKFLIRAAKAVATSLSCDSVLLALDNQVKNNYVMHEREAEFGKEFFQFIRPDWMKGIRLYTQTKLLNFNLLGTDYMAHKLAEE